MNKKGNILVIDDDPYIILSLKTLLEQHFEYVKDLRDPNDITEELNNNSFDVILLDMNFKPGDTSGKDGIFWLKKILEIEPLSNVIMITAYGGINVAVDAIKSGAIDFVVKPWQNEKL